MPRRCTSHFSVPVVVSERSLSPTRPEYDQWDAVAAASCQNSHACTSLDVGVGGVSSREPMEILWAKDQEHHHHHGSKYIDHVVTINTMDWRITTRNLLAKLCLISILFDSTMSVLAVGLLFATSRLGSVVLSAVNTNVRCQHLE